LSFIIEDCLNEGGRYDEITSRYVEYYYYCRIKLASGNSWLKDEWEIYYAYSQLQPVFTTPLEQLKIGASELASDLSSLGFWNYKKFSERLESHYS